METLHRILSAFLFIPIFIFAVLSIIFNNLFKFFNSFHFQNFWLIPIPDEILKDIQTEPQAEAGIRVIVYFISFFSSLISELINLRYKF